MREHRTALILNAFALALILGAGGCAGGRSHLGEVSERKATISKGRKDKHNRFRSIVQVIVNEPIGDDREIAAVAEAREEKDEYYECSGVLIGPKLVLTAGHCVCKRQETRLRERGQPRAKVLVNASLCAKAVTVKTVSFHQPPDQPGQDIKEYEVSQVVPHPRLKVRVDRYRRLESEAHVRGNGLDLHGHLLSLEVAERGWR